MILPWHETHWTQLTQERDSYPHGFLFAGPKGIGKQQLAIAFARHLLNRPHAFDNVSHPDFHVLIPEDQMDAEGDILQRYGGRYFVSQKGQKPKSVISVDQIRLLSSALTTHSHASGNKVILIFPAERMNINAANALLKALEEPSSATIFILVCNRPDLLPATVRSRCSRVDLRIPEQEQALNWLRPQLGRHDPELLLRLAGGAPLLALTLTSGELIEGRKTVLEDMNKSILAGIDVAAAAERWKSIGVAESLSAAQRMLVDMVRVYFQAEPKTLYNPDQLQWLQKAVKRIHLPLLFPLIEKIGKYLQDIEGPLDKNLVLEDTLGDLIKLAQTPGNTQIIRR